MKRTTTKWIRFVVLTLTTCWTWTAMAQQDHVHGQGIEVRAELQNLFLFRNDSDFDRSQPMYDQNGQTVGAFATVFRPSATWNIRDNLRLYYELEIGLNYWSKQNPDEPNALAPDVFVMKHREIFGAGEFLDDALGFKVGYQRVIDATGLFINHWIGAGQVSWAWSDNFKAGFLLGQIPDQTYEGINVTDNNFIRDIFLAALFGKLSLQDDLRMDFGAHYLYDSHLVGQTRWLVCPNFHLEFGQGNGVVDSGMKASIDLALQAGQSQNAVLGGGYQNNLAWAAQGHLEIRATPWTLSFNLLATSPDDAYEGNRNNYAFLYSGKNKSATIMITEDEIRDWYDNIDERMSTYRGGFFSNRAGLLVADAKAAWEVNDIFVPALIVGAATVLKPKNALDQVFVGLETDLLLTFNIEENLVAQVAGGLMVPGGAGAALANKIDLHKTDLMYMAEASLRFAY